MLAMGGIRFLDMEHKPPVIPTFLGYGVDLVLAPYLFGFPWLLGAFYNHDGHTGR
jgi:hypothetical protein